MRQRSMNARNPRRGRRLYWNLGGYERDFHHLRVKVVIQPVVISRTGSTLVLRCSVFAVLITTFALCGGTITGSSKALTSSNIEEAVLNFSGS